MKINHNKCILSATIIVFLLSNLIFANGLDGEFYVNQRWRNLFTGYSPTVNPAFMMEKEQASTRIALSSYLPDSTYLMECGIVLPVGLFQAIGFSYLGKRARGQNLYEGNSHETSRGIVYSYAINPWRKLSVGVNFNVFKGRDHEKGSEAETKHRYYCSDIGISYRFLRHPILGSHLTGISLQNALSMDIPFNHWQNQPVNVRFSWLAEIWEGRINPGVDLSLVNDGSDETEIELNSRIGIKRFPFNAHLQIGDDYWGASAGLDLIFAQRNELQLAFQYLSAFERKSPYSFTLYCNYNFRMERQEKFSQKMARTTGGHPSKLYHLALKMYSLGRYYEALCINAKMIVAFPSFFKNDWIFFFAGSCSNQLDMQELAHYYFKKLKEDYPKSYPITCSYLEFMQMHFRNRDEEKFNEYFDLLQEINCPDSLRYHSFHLMADHNVLKKDYNEAIKYYDSIPENYPRYSQLQFSKAAALLLTSRANEAVEIFSSIIQEDKPGTVADTLLKIRSHSMLLMNDIKSGNNKTNIKTRAHNYLQNIPPGKIRDSVQSNNSFLIETETVVINAEEMLEKNNYAGAETILRALDDSIANHKQNRESADNNIKMEYKRIQEPYKEFARELDTMLCRGHTHYIIQKLDSLQVIQKEYQRVINDSRSNQDDFSWRMVWNKKIEELHGRVKKALRETEVLLKKEDE